MNNKLTTVAVTNRVESALAGRIYSIRASKDTENGELVLPGDIEPENLTVHEGIVPEKGAKGVAFVSNVVIGDECVLNGLDENQYYMEEGEVVRAYKLVPTDMVSVTKAGFTNPDALEGFVPGETDLYATVGENGKMELTEEEQEEGFYAKVVTVRPRKGINAGFLQRRRTGEVEELVYLEVKAN